MRGLTRSARYAASAVGLSLLTLGAAVALGGSPPDRVTSTVGSRGLDRAGLTGAGATSALQQHLREHPRDHRGWAELGLAYVEAARVGADPTYYAKADQALARARRLAPADDLALTGAATLAAARHDFASARTLADQALVANPFSAQAKAVRADALTELGDYRAALVAARQADQLEPGTATFARLSYAAELRGDLPGATRLMTGAREAAGSPESFAFAAAHLGELARAGGDWSAAARHYATALGAVPTYPLAIVGRARLAVAAGDLRAAERDYTGVVRRLPLPEYVVELGELYQATGRPALARQQYAVAAAAAALARANGVGTDLETALFGADHGDARAALRAARAEWARRHSIHAADALGWALHAAGRDRAALPFVRAATALGTRDARLLLHRGVVEAAAGSPAAARAHLTAALRIDGGSSPLRERAAQSLLARLGGTS